MPPIIQTWQKNASTKTKKVKKVFCEYSCFLARGGQRAACQKCQGKNVEGKILNVIIIILLLFVIISGKVYLLLFIVLFIATKKRRDPKTSPLFYVSLLFFIMNTPTIYTLSFYYVYDDHV
jgi:heme/copper-type cytochrome/quinol oxidase subunit 2